MIKTPKTNIKQKIILGAHKITIEKIISKFVYHHYTFLTTSKLIVYFKCQFIDLFKYLLSLKILLMYLIYFCAIYQANEGINTAYKILKLSLEN